MAPAATSSTSAPASSRFAPSTVIAGPGLATGVPGPRRPRPRWPTPAARHTRDSAILHVCRHPEPMVALPCGSRSISNTRCPILDRPAARLTVVVVLPTPPFWLAMQKILGHGSSRVKEKKGLCRLFGPDQPDAKADQEHAGDFFEHSADDRTGAQSLGQEMREQHDDQPVEEGQDSNGGGQDTEGQQTLVTRRIDEQRERTPCRRRWPWGSAR
jgi:hypothetical protein